MSFIKLTYILAVGWLVALAIPVMGQEGPELSCENCPDFHEIMQYPSGGIWYNPEQSGTGFTLDVQDGIVAGYYFLYAEDGRPEWLMFSGSLELASDSDARWLLETDLLRVTGGACLNCPYREVEDVATVGTLSMEFGWRNHGQYSVNGGPVQNIVPMAYAIPMLSIFQPHSDYRIPTPFEGSTKSPPLSTGIPPSNSWVFVFKARSGTGHSYAMLPITRVFQSSDETGNYRLRLGALLGGEFAHTWGALTCWSEEESGPLCRIDFNLSATQDHIDDHFVRQPFYLAPGNFGNDRIEAESENGRVTLVGYPQYYD